MVSERGKALRRLWVGQCTVIERQCVEDPVTKRTRYEEVTVLENLACHLSFSSSPATDGRPVAAVTQSVKLFLAPEHEIKPGSKIIVTQRGRTETYKSSGVAEPYSDHQEILLELFERWA